MKKLKKGDEVIVITGKDKGKKGTILSFSADDKLLVDGINKVKKHVKPNPNKGTTGGIEEKLMPIHRSNVALYNPVTKKGDRVGFRLLADGTKVRFFKTTNEIVDV